MKVLVIAVLLSGASNALAQPPAERLAMSGTLREALMGSGFEDGIPANDGPDS
jgi:hypothetical protein